MGHLTFIRTVMRRAKHTFVLADWSFSPACVYCSCSCYDDKLTMNSQFVAPLSLPCPFFLFFEFCARNSMFSKHNEVTGAEQTIWRARRFDVFFSQLSR